MQHSTEWTRLRSELSDLTVKELITMQVNLENLVEVREQETEKVRLKGRVIQSLLDHRKPTDE